MENPDFLKAWEVITSNFLSHAEENSKHRGVGICVYRLLKIPRTDGKNCEFWYADYKSMHWSQLIKECKFEKEMDKDYTDDLFLICVQIPIDEKGEKYIGSMKFFPHDPNSETILEQSKTKTVLRHRKKITL